MSPTLCSQICKKLGVTEAPDDVESISFTSTNDSSQNTVFVEICTYLRPKPKAPLKSSQESPNSSTNALRPKPKAPLKSSQDAPNSSTNALPPYSEIPLEGGQVDPSSFAGALPPKPETPSKSRRQIVANFFTDVFRLVCLKPGTPLRRDQVDPNSPTIALINPEDLNSNPLPPPYAEIEILQEGVPSSSTGTSSTDTLPIGTFSAGTLPTGTLPTGTLPLIKKIEDAICTVAEHGELEKIYIMASLNMVIIDVWHYPRPIGQRSPNSNPETTLRVRTIPPMGELLEAQLQNLTKLEFIIPREHQVPDDLEENLAKFLGNCPRLGHVFIEYTTGPRKGSQDSNKHISLNNLTMYIQWLHFESEEEKPIGLFNLLDLPPTCNVMLRDHSLLRPWKDSFPGSPHGLFRTSASDIETVEIISTSWENGCVFTATFQGSKHKTFLQKSVTPPDYHVWHSIVEDMLNFLQSTEVASSIKTLRLEHCMNIDRAILEQVCKIAKQGPSKKVILEVLTDEEKWQSCKELEGLLEDLKVKVEVNRVNFSKRQ